MFRFDLTTARTSQLTKLAWPTCEDVSALQVLGRAPIWILDVAAEGADDDSSPRRYLFCELSNVLEIGLGQTWRVRKLHLLTASQDVPSIGGALLPIDSIWLCEAGPGQLCFEIVGKTVSRYLDEFGHSVSYVARRIRQLWPELSNILSPAGKAVE